ncbi:hypothetical protein AGMMS50229_13420 [Campylobacterota bacterium]|nr:hypothetical protein AGMMS50229_13420 [Campylobacterota bacterium]
MHDTKSNKRVKIDPIEKLGLKSNKEESIYKYSERELCLPRNTIDPNPNKWGWLFDEAKMQAQIDITAEEINNFLADYKKYEAEIIEAAKR